MTTVMLYVNTETLHLHDYEARHDAEIAAAAALMTLLRVGLGGAVTVVNENGSPLNRYSAKQEVPS